MICTKNLVSDIAQVPHEWIWSYYCDMWESDWDGTNYTTLSIFRQERTPSMKVYYKDDKYYFKDFSSGYGGDEIELVKSILRHKDQKADYFRAVSKIICDYNHWLSTTDNNRVVFKISEHKKQKKYDIKFKTRGWNELDKKYWTSYHIGSKLLNYYNVAALESFTMTSDGDTFTITGEYIYGYFNSKAELVKIYQPKSKKKFIYVKPYLQGSEQVQSNDVLIIQSGLKDIMAFKSMRLKTDDIAPDSENTLISSAIIKSYIKAYKFVLIMFDNDEAGHTSSLKYISMYPKIRVVYHSTGFKDVADIVKGIGVKRSRELFVPLIDKVINSEPMLKIEYPSLF